VLLFVLGVFAYQTWQAASALFAARGKAVQVERLIRAGDFDAATRELHRLRDDTHRAASATDGLLWDLGRHLPVVGADVGAVQTAASALDTVTRENAPVALGLCRAVDGGRRRPRNGRIDLRAVRELTPTVQRAAASIQGQAARLDALDLDAVTFPFEQVIRELAGEVGRAEDAATASATAFELLPRMLGAEEPRSYLLLIQNNAETRSTGGIPGSVAILHAHRGRLRMGFQGSARDISPLEGPVGRMSPSALAVYGETMLTDARDATFNPDFPVVAGVVAAMLEQRRGTRVDGVVSVDPIALSFLLGGTGPVELEQSGRPVSLNQGNVVPVLLNLTYQLRPDPASQDDFFESAARAIFDTVMAGRGRSARTITGLATGTAEHRVLLWSRRPDEQRRIAGTAVSGELPADPEDPHPHVGFYLNDATAGKPEYYLDYQPSVRAVRCRPEGRQDLEASIALSSSMPRDVSGLSPFITGTGQFAPKGTIAVNLRIYGPVGGSVTRLTVDGESISVTSDRHEDRQVAAVPLSLRPGERVVVRAQLTTGPGQSAGPVLSFTPGVQSQPNGVQLGSACTDAH
jgi:hypothetical protein